ncbi:hypothetical protein RUM44_002106 [Polyplax serrata]|uniref:Uncharacterized protein n=1 Tax=Polyplax serrata TaxID=468196 RepID=A0ABR1ALZ1_POLSC
MPEESNTTNESIPGTWMTNSHYKWASVVEHCASDCVCVSFIGSGGISWRNEVMNAGRQEPAEELDVVPWQASRYSRLDFQVPDMRKIENRQGVQT